MIKSSNVTRDDVRSKVLECLKEYAELQINLKSGHAREAIATRISSDIMSLLAVDVISPDSVKKY
jgi:hypothetical protein